VALVHEVLSLQPKTSELAKRYDNYALRSFVEDNRAMVWCVGEAQSCRDTHACAFRFPVVVCRCVGEPAKGPNLLLGVCMRGAAQHCLAL
jgi:hypothetical protein